MSDLLVAFHSSQTENIAVRCGRYLWSACVRASVILTITVFGWATISFAQFGRAVAKFQDEEDDFAPRQFRMTEQSFDQMVFGGKLLQAERQADGRLLFKKVASQSDSADFQKRMEALATTEIDVVDRRVSLTEAQRKKLNLAARGDIKQFVSRAAGLRLKLTSKSLNQQEYTELKRELEPLRMALQIGILAENSLFRKTLRTNLTDEQRVSFRTLQRERQAGIIITALQNMEVGNNSLKLTGETRRKFANVILEHGHLPQNAGPYAKYIVLLEANLMRDRVEPLLTEAEREKFEAQVDTAKSVEQALETYGIWTARRSQTNDEDADDEMKD